MRGLKRAQHRLWVAMVLALLAAPVLAENALRLPKASSSLLLDIVSTGERLLAVGEHGHVLLSDDNGVNWTQAEVPTRQMLTAVHFPSAQRGWAVGHDGLILATVDGGAHWALQREGLSEQLKMNRENLQLLLQGQERLEQQLLQAASIAERASLHEQLDELKLDVQDAEAVLKEAVNAPPLLDVFFLDELRGFAVGAFNTLLQTTDGGISWLRQSGQLDNPDGFHLNAITGSLDGRLWIAAEGGLLMYSPDAGATWEAMTSPYQGSWFGIIHAAGTDTILIFGLRGNVFRSANGGTDWHRVTVTTDRSLAGGCFVNSNYVLLVGAVGTLLVSTDGGRTFSLQWVGQRQHLSAVVGAADKAVVVGQGGVRLAQPYSALP